MGDDVSCGAKAVNPEPLGLPCFHECAVTDEPGAEQRRRFGASSSSLVKLRQGERRIVWRPEDSALHDPHALMQINAITSRVSY